MPMVMVMVVMVPTPMLMVMPMRMLTTIFQFIFQKVAHNSTTNRTQQAVVLLMSKIISRGSAGKGASDATFTLGIAVLI
jgi:hypothetical protein